MQLAEEEAAPELQSDLSLYEEEMKQHRDTYMEQCKRTCCSSPWGRGDKVTNFGPVIDRDLIKDEGDRLIAWQTFELPRLLKNQGTLQQKDLELQQKVLELQQDKRGTFLLMVMFAFLLLMKNPPT